MIERTKRTVAKTQQTLSERSKSMGCVDNFSIHRDNRRQTGASQAEKSGIPMEMG
jgi:hypothetical protein